MSKIHDDLMEADRKRARVESFIWWSRVIYYASLTLVLAGAAYIIASLW